METVIGLIVIGVRFFVAGAFLLSLIVAFTFSLVRKGHLKPFGWWANLVRRLSEPLLRPLERRLVRAGANPADAPAWLAGVTLVGGLVVVALVNWLIGFGLSIYEAIQAGALLPVAVQSAFELLKLAIMIRVLASWFTISPYSQLMRLVHGLTDWIVDPIRRILPNIGMLDFSPLVAWFVLSFSERMVIQGLFQ